MARSFDHRPGTDLADLEAACMERVADSKSLLVAGQFSMAIAMAIYALEIQLKASICKRLRLSALPRSLEFHDLEPLLTLSGHRSAMDQELAVKMNFQELSRTADRLNEFRYRPSNQTGSSNALGTRTLHQLTDPQHGVLPWLQRQPN